MSTLLWKEFRENLKWGVILFVASLLFQLGSQFVMPDQLALTHNEFEQMLILACPIAALALGVLQTFREVSRDRWAYLMHRAATPHQVLWAKAIVGLGMYLAAGLLPLMILSLWSSTPGNVAAPWHWMAPFRPLLIMVFCTPFWFVGALVSVRNVRWYGTRLLVFGLPMLLMVSSIGATTFQNSFGLALSLVVTLISLACMAVLARNTFERRGQYQQLRTPARSVLALTVSLSVIIALFTSLGLSLELSRQFWMPDNYRIVQTTIMEDGRFEEIVSETIDGKRTHTRKVEGEKVDFDTQFPEWPWWPDWIPEGELTGRNPRVPFRADLLITDQRDNWHFLPEEGVFFGYQRVSRQHILTITPEGFQSADQPVKKRFGSMVSCEFDYELELKIGQEWVQSKDPETSLNDNRVFAFDNGVYYINKTTGVVREIYSAPSDNPLRGIRFSQVAPGYSLTNGKRPKYPLLVTALHEKTIRQFVITEEGAAKLASSPLTPQLFEQLENQTFVLPAGMSEDRYLRFLGFRNSGKCVYAVGEYRQDHNVTHLIAADDQGNVRRDVVVDHQVVEPSFQALRVLMPPGYMILSWSSDATSTINFAGVPREDKTEAPRAMSMGRLLLIVAVFSTICGWLLCVDRRLSRRATIAWTAFAACVGLGGLVALVGIVPRARRVPCHACHKRRPVDESRCPHCGADFEPPPHNGTEIIIREPELVPATVE